MADELPKLQKRCNKYPLLEQRLLENSTGRSFAPSQHKTEHEWIRPRAGLRNNRFRHSACAELENNILLYSEPDKSACKVEAAAGKILEEQKPGDGDEDSFGKGG